MKKKPSKGFTLIELLIVIAIVLALAALGVSIAKSAKEKANRVAAMQKMRAIGNAFVGYTSDHNGLMPFEDATGPNDWNNAALPENKDVWYNAIPAQMGAQTVGELGATNPAGFYDKTYPLFIPGAPYPGANKRLGEPIFAVAMNSRLQRKGDDDVKKQGTLASLQNPGRTVTFLERGLPDDKKVYSGLKGYDGSPKANPRAFAPRHNQSGILIFADGHAEAYKASDLISKSGIINFPQKDVVWTPNPEEDPN